MRFSIITPTFNRREVVRRSLDSSLQFVRAAGDGEVVVVDDASRDGTVEMLHAQYTKELSGGLIKLVARQTNGGSTVAKSDGARTASGDWLVFLDSDDELTPGAAHAMPAFVDAHRDAAVCFFRCIDQTGHLIGPPMPLRMLSLEYLLAVGTPGECLPVISRTAFLEYPADNDPLGFEFLATLRIVRAYGPAALSDAVARRYYTSHDDRLSSRTGNLQRAKKHVVGLRRTLSEFGTLIPWRKRLGIFLRIFCYSVIAALMPASTQQR
jgi:glycosyltransferase involved in cell wall biosynthesis